MHIRIHVLTTEVGMQSSVQFHTYIYTSILEYVIPDTFPVKFTETVECNIITLIVCTSRGMDGKSFLMLHRHIRFPIGRECELAGWRAETLRSRRGIAGEDVGSIHNG